MRYAVYALMLILPRHYAMRHFRQRLSRLICHAALLLAAYRRCAAEDAPCHAADTLYVYYADADASTYCLITPHICAHTRFACITLSDTDAADGDARAFARMPYAPLRAL